MKLNILNFVPMGRSMLRPYENLSSNAGESHTDSFGEYIKFR